MQVLTIDAGTTGVTALAVSEQGEVVTHGYREFAQLSPARAGRARARRHLDGDGRRLPRGAGRHPRRAVCDRLREDGVEKGGWSDELCDLFDVPRAALPELVPSSGVVDTTDPDSLLGRPARRVVIMRRTD